MTPKEIEVSTPLLLRRRVFLKPKWQRYIHGKASTTSRCWAADSEVVLAAVTDVDALRRPMNV